MTNIDDPRVAFIEAACAPLDSWHASGTLECANAILAAHPEVAKSDIHTAAILGDANGVRGFLALDPASATALLDAGASANAGWYESTHQPDPTWESVLYGAAGVAHHPEMTRLLLAAPKATLLTFAAVFVAAGHSRCWNRILCSFQPTASR